MRVYELARELGVTLENLGLGRCEHGVEPTDDRQRQDDLAVLGLLVVPTQ